MGGQTSGRRVDYAAEVARLDAVSRTRALTTAESLLLERYLERTDAPARKRAPYGNTRELARQGVKRWQADRAPQRRWCDQCCRTVSKTEVERCKSQWCAAKIFFVNPTEQISAGA